jgi:hypothetical protein
MTCVLHHRLADHANVLDVAYSTDRSCAPGRAMHAAGVEFYHAFFIRQSAQTDRIVVGVVLRPLDHLNRSLQRISTPLQERVGSLSVWISVVRADDDGGFAGVILRGMPLLACVCKSLRNTGLGSHSRSYSAQH